MHSNLHPTHRMKEKDTTEEDYLQELSPTLFPKRKDFERTAPDGYFDSLSGKVLSKSGIEEANGKGKIFHILNYRNLAIAAGLALLLASIAYLRSQSNGATQTGRAIATVTTDSSASELLGMDDQSYVTLLSDELIYEAYNDDQYATISLNEELNDEMLVEYLISEGVSYDLLFEME